MVYLLEDSHLLTYTRTRGGTNLLIEHNALETTPTVIAKQ